MNDTENIKKNLKGIKFIDTVTWLILFGSAWYACLKFGLVQTIAKYVWEVYILINFYEIIQGYVYLRGYVY